MTLKKIIILLFAGILCDQLFVACISFQKYPSSWPAKNEVTIASQLSGKYDPKLLNVLHGFMELPYVEDSGSVKVELFVNDSLQYAVRAVPASDGIANISDTALIQADKTPSHGRVTINGFIIKRKFKAGKGLRFSYDPQQKVRQSPAINFVSRDYVLLNKDKDGNLVVKYGEQQYGLFFIFFPFVIDDHEWISVRRDSVVYTKRRLM